MNIFGYVPGELFTYLSSGNFIRQVVQCNVCG